MSLLFTILVMLLWFRIGDGSPDQPKDWSYWLATVLAVLGAGPAVALLLEVAFHILWAMLDLWAAFDGPSWW